MEPEPAWVSHHPELARSLQNLSDRECEALADAPEHLLDWASEWLPVLRQRAGLIELPQLAGMSADAGESTLPEIRATDMPGRKRLQAGAFAASVRPLHHGILDWCCGKGHLARTLAAVGEVPVQGWEWNPALVADGNHLARQFGDPVSLACQDVMAGDLALPPEVHGVALHACGDLHRRLLREGAGRSLPRLSFSPCCYHLTDSDTYRLLSHRGRGYSDALSLTPFDLRLAVQETVTASARVRSQTALASTWRLGFDGLQRQLRGVDEYLPVPSHPPRLLQQDFAAFCRWAAGKRGVALPESVDFGHWEGFGRQRLARVRRHELVRHLFRRPLEVWLVLDYALYLEEQGYEVCVGTFCDRQLTPRNILVDARRQPATGI